MPNLVEIIIKAKNESKAAFTEAKADGASFSSTMSKVGFIGGAALLGVGVASVKMASTFQSSITSLNTQAGVSKKALGGLQAGVLDLAGKVGESPDSLAQALYHIESSFQSLGIKGPKALNLLKIAAEGAKVGHADLVDVTNALDGAIASGIPGVKNMSQAMGVLNATVGAGDMHMQDLADAFGTGMLATVKGFGLSIKDVGAALAVFGDNNIRGAKAGTDLRMAVQALGAPSTSDVATTALKKLGLSYTQLSSDMQKGGLKLAMNDLVQHMKDAGVTGSKTGEILTEVFGKKAGAGINILASQIDRFNSKYPDMIKGANNFGSAWATTQKTVSQQMDEIKGSAQSVMIEIGSKLLPVVSGFLGVLSRNKGAVGGIAIGLAAIAGAATAYAGAVKAVAFATKVWAGVQTLLDGALDANAIGVIVFAVAALSAGIYEAWKHSALFRTVLKDIGIAGLEMVKVLLGAFQLWTGAYLDMIGVVVRGAADAFGWVPGLGPKLKAAATGFTNFKNTVWNGFSDAISKVSSWQQSLEGSKKTVSDVTAAARQDFAGQSKATQQAKTDMDSLTNAITKNGAQSLAAQNYRKNLIADLQNAGVDAGKAQKDVDAYTQAVAKNGAQSDQAKAARETLNKDIQTAFKNSEQGKKDLDAYTQAVQKNGAQSDSAKSARAQLIKDLENTGVNAKTARGIVDNLTTAIKKVPGNANTKFKETVQPATFKISTTAGSVDDPIGELHLSAKGSRVPGYGGGDKHLYLLEGGEAVVSKETTAKHAGELGAWGVPGFRTGGLVPDTGWLGGKINNAVKTDVAAALKADLATAIRKDIKAAQAADAAAKAKAAAASGGGGPVGGDEAKNKAIGQKMVAAAGWASQFPAFNSIAMAESGWNRTITNGGRPYNSYNVAYGIPQALPASKMGAAANPPTSSASAQIAWMISYIRGQYGNPDKAWAFHQAHSYYDKGGLLQPGVTMAVNNTGQPEMILPPSLGNALTSTNGPMASLTKAITNPGGPIAKLGKTAADPGGPIAKVGKGVTDPGGPMAKVGSGVASGAAVDSLAKALNKADGPMMLLAAALNADAGAGGGGGGGGSGGGSGGGGGGLAGRKARSKGSRNPNPGGLIKKPAPGKDHKSGGGHTLKGHHPAGGGGGDGTGPVKLPGGLVGGHRVKRPPAHAAGGAGSGWISVAEQGRELIKVPNGSTVMSNPDTERMAASGSGGAALVQLEIAAGGNSDFEQMFLTMIRKFVRVNGGGSVQTAFGRS